MADDGVKISALTEVLTEPATGEIVASVVGGVTYKRDIGKRLPSTMQKSALAGYGGTPSGTNPYATQTGATALAATAARPLSDLSRVMRINGDGVPTFPDNVAGRTYYKDPGDWLLTDFSYDSSVTPSITGGKYRIAKASTAGYITVYKPIDWSTKLVGVKVSASYAGIVRLGATIASVFISLKEVTILAGQTIYIDCYIPASCMTFYITLIGSIPVGQYLEVDTIYIGSGLYDTPVYDKACCNRFTNNGVLPVKGPRGQALSFNGAQSLVADNPVIGTSGTIAFWVKRRTVGTEQVAVYNGTYPQFGISLYFMVDNTLRLNVYNGIPYFYGTQVVSDTDSWHSIVITFNVSAIIFNIDGVDVETIANPQVPAPATRALIIGSTEASALFNGELSSIEYDTAIWTLAQKQRFYNGDDVVDSQQKAITNVPNAIKVCDSKGNIRQPGLPVYADNTAALAGGLVAGEPYRTSTGVLMVVY